MKRTLNEVMEMNWDGVLSDEEVEAELNKRGFEPIEKAIYWLAKRAVELENKYDLETGALDGYKL
jgi:hypothetical protein